MHDLSLPKRHSVHFELTVSDAWYQTLEGLLIPISTPVLDVAFEHDQVFNTLFHLSTAVDTTTTTTTNTTVVQSSPSLWTALCLVVEARRKLVRVVRL